VVAWEVTVEVRDPEARAAYERCAETSAAVVDRLKEIAHVETRTISVHRDWEDGRYQHEAEMEVAVRAPIAHAAELAEAAMAAGAQRLQGPERNACPSSPGTSRSGRASRSCSRSPTEGARRRRSAAAVARRPMA
jgi:uncharacterized protein YggE